MKEKTALAICVKELRKKHKLSQEDLAIKAGVGIHFVRDLEQGKKSLRMDKVNDVLLLFNFQLMPQKIKSHE